MKTKIYKEGESKFWSDKVMDLANLSAISLVFSQFVTDKVYWQAVSFGVILYLSLIIFVIFLRRRR